MKRRLVAVLTVSMVMLGLLVAATVVRSHDLSRICESQRQTVTTVRAAFTELKKTVLDSYRQFPPDKTRRERDAAFFNAVLLVLKQPDC